jgi:hypothetical protein
MQQRGGRADGIELGDAVAVVREELLRAAAEGAGQDVRFEVGEIQMEFTVELSSGTTAGAKVRAWVVDAGAENSRTSTRTHRVAVTMTPKNARTGGPWRVGSETEGSTAGFGRNQGE